MKRAISVLLAFLLILALAAGCAPDVSVIPNEPDDIPDAGQTPSSPDDSEPEPEPEPEPPARKVLTDNYEYDENGNLTSQLRYLFEDVTAIYREQRKYTPFEE